MRDDEDRNYPIIDSIVPSMDNFMQSIKEAIYGVIREKLVGNIEITMQQYKDQSKDNNVNGNLQLLQAIKPFVNEKAADNIDQLSDVFGDMQALKMFVNQHVNNRNSEEYKTSDIDEKTRIVDRQGDLIIEDNTVYEIDESCKPKITSQSVSEHKGNIYAMMLLMLSGQIHD